MFAGGTDVLVQLRAGRFDLDVLVDLKGIPEANSLGLNEGLSIGAAVPCYQIYENQEVTTRFPGIIDAASLIGGIQIQSRASIGGNLCNASPSADGICPLIGHSGAAQIVGPLQGRAVPVEEFCTGPGNNILADNEFLVAIDVPEPPANFGAAYHESTNINHSTAKINLMKLIPKLFGLALSNIFGKQLLKESIDIVTPDGQVIPLRPQNSTAAHTLTVNNWSFFWDIVAGYDLGLAESYIKGKWDHDDLASLFQYLASKTTDDNLPSIGNFAPKKMYARFIQRIISTYTIK